MFQYIKMIWQALIGSETIRQGVYPTSADGVAALAVTLTAAAAWTWGAWAQIVAATAAKCQIESFTLENIVGGPLQGEVAIASGAGGFEVELGRWPVVSPYYRLAKPIEVQAGVRLAARLRTSTGVADTVDIKLCVTTGYE